MHVEALAETSEIVFFLIGAMGIVETVDAYNGFQFVTDRIRTTDKAKLAASIATVTFLLSAVPLPSSRVSHAECLVKRREWSRV